MIRWESGDWHCLHAVHDLAIGALFIAENMYLLYLAANNGKQAWAVKKYNFFSYNEKLGNMQPEANAEAQHSHWNPRHYLALPTILPVVWQFAL